MKRILIVGGGAAGLAAALAAAEHAPQAEIVILERMDRVGKKILATGNGRCNLTNKNAAPGSYDTSDPAALKEMMTGMSSESVVRFFRQLGLYCTEEDAGRIYPYCHQASMVLDVLLQNLEKRGVRLETGCSVKDIQRKNGQWQVKTVEKSFLADCVILTAGGKAAEKLGSDGSGLKLAEKLGYSCTPLYPALVALTCDMRQMGGLKGIRAQAGVTLYCGKNRLGEQNGEVQFTDYGLSGIPVMQLSGAVGRLKAGMHCTAFVDLFPEWTQEALLQELCQRKKRLGDDCVEVLLLGLIHKRLAYAVLKSAGIQPLSAKIGLLSDRQLQQLSETLKAWSFTVTGTQGFENAQVTGGGVLLREINAKTMESLKQKNIFLAGEILDVAGQCGGYNLHWAWCSGIRAGRCAAKKV